jgi:hypothetical protein
MVTPRRASRRNARIDSGASGGDARVMSDRALRKGPVAAADQDRKANRRDHASVAPPKKDPVEGDRPRKCKPGHVILVAVGAISAALAGCGDDFEANPGTSGTAGAAGGAAGSGGTAGNGGAAGSGGGQACSENSDCDDGLACNGIETCTAGKCGAGTAPCTNPDPAHCSVTCSEPAGTCSVTANDADNDGHKDAKCSADPGDDCDDDDPNTYPGAAEICDGKDNDCDGIDDLRDGHTLAGSAKTIVSVVGVDTYAPEVAWCPEAKTFVVVWTDTRDGSPNIYGATLSTAGVLGPHKRISPNGSESEPRIACTGGQCAVVWRRTAPNDLYLRPIDCAVTPTGPAVSIPESGDSAAHLAPAVAAFNGGWLAAFSWKSTVGLQASIRAFGLDGSAKGAPQIVQTNTNLSWESSLAATSTHAAYVWAVTLAGGNPVAVEWSRIDQSLDASATQALTPEPPPTGEASRGAEVAVHGSNFAVAWRHTSGSGAVIRFTERSAAGGSVCDAPSLGSPTDPRVGGIASHPSSALLALISGAGPTGVSMQLMRVQGCALLDTHMLATNLAVQSPDERSLAIAGGAEGYATVFAAGYTGSRMLSARVFGANLCD